MFAMGLNFEFARGGEIGSNRARMGPFYWIFLLQGSFKPFRFVMVRYCLKRVTGRLGGRHGGSARIGHRPTKNARSFPTRGVGGLEF